MTDRRGVQSAAHPRPARSAGQLLLTTIIVSYNTRDLTLRCLRALEASTDARTSQTVVIDNCSRDASAEAIAHEFPTVDVVTNTDNVGFARAVNQGLARASGGYVLLLNPDCEVGPTTVNALLSYLQSHPAVGVVAPRIWHPENRHSVLSAGYLPSVARLAAHFFGLNRVRILGRRLPALNLRPGPDTEGAREVEWVSGACLLASRALFDELGGLSERWFMYAEDMEFCARVLRTGRSVVHLSSAEVSHEVGASAEGISTYWIDNLEDLYVHLYRPGRWALYLWRAVFTAGLAVQAVGFRLRARVRPADGEAWRAKSRTFVAYTKRSLRRRGAKQ